MGKVRGRGRTIAVTSCLVLLLALSGVYLASCGGNTKSAGSQGGINAAKLPPGVSQDELTQLSSAPSSQPSSSSPGATTQAAKPQGPSASADLAGARFTVVNATRPDTNKSVITSSQREIKGDYLEVELTIEDVGTGLVDLSEYSFRLESPGIAADTYADYYGNVGTYGAYVSENKISATLLGYSDLAAVTYKVKVGELVTKVFCFFDLNPDSVARNEGVTKDNTSYIIRKVSGSDYGDQVTIPLAGYSD
jgi:hypothetical protein